MREVSRSRLVLADGREVYVEPSTFARSGSAVLLAGTPNYVWRPVAGRPVALEARFGHFGAAIGADGRVSLVPSPLDARLIKHVRVLGRGDGVWDAVFIELEPPGWVAGEAGVAARVWHGVVDGRRWLRLEEMPRPTGARVYPGSTPPALIRRGDTLAWALPVETPGGQTEAVVYERRNGRWSYELVPTNSPAYLVPAYSDSLGLVLAVVRALPPAEENGLYFLVRRHSWQTLRRPADRVYEPSLTFAGTAGFLTWRTLLPDEGGMRWEARAMIGHLEAQDGPIVRLDSSVVHMAAPVSPRTGTRLWVVDHVGEGGRGNELRVIRDSAETAVVLTRIPSPFQGFFAAALQSPVELLIAGPVPGRTETEPGVVTLLLRLRVQCPRGVGRPD
ncbi:MAG: hypothetical protein ABR499_12520 [Gemmatimonadaceae bacterium]